MAVDKLPEPTPVYRLDQTGDVWRAHLSGVGGMGIGVVNAILVRAGHKEGYRVLFQDKKGLAIRNGGVYGQMTFIKDDAEESGVRQQGSGNPSYATTGAIPYGKADLLLGVDVLESERSIDPRRKFRHAE